VKNNRAIVAGGLFPHLSDGNRHLITAEIQGVNLTTGAIEFQRNYPLGDLRGQAATATDGDWVVVAASPDARYLAENGVFNGTVLIRDTTTGKQLATLHGYVHGFNWDGTRIVLDTGGGPFAEVQVATWSNQKIVWHGPGIAQSILARPNSNDIMIGVSSPSGDSSILITVDGDGHSRVLGYPSINWPCPCPIGI
jgi:hypothetical protein